MEVMAEGESCRSSDPLVGVTRPSSRPERPQEKATSSFNGANSCTRQRQRGRTKALELESVKDTKQKKEEPGHPDGFQKPLALTSPPRNSPRSQLPAAPFSLAQSSPMTSVGGHTTGVTEATKAEQADLEWLIQTLRDCSCPQGLFSFLWGIKRQVSYWRARVLGLRDTSSPHPTHCTVLGGSKVDGSVQCVGQRVSTAPDHG